MAETFWRRRSSPYGRGGFRPLSPLEVQPSRMEPSMLTATHATPIDATAVKAALDRLDHVAREAERKWGIGRLRLLVDDELRAKFDRQARLLDDALWGSPASVDGKVILAQINAME